MKDTPPNIYVGIVGKKESGKTTAAAMLRLVFQTWYKHTYTIAFADALKEELAYLTGGDLATINKNKPQLRRVLQFYGDLKREVAPEYFINKVEDLILKLPKPHFVVMHDVRFLNEARFIKEVLGGILIRITRNPCNCATGYYTTMEDPLIIRHASEMEQEKIRVDFSIDNGKTLTYLEKMEIPTITQYIKTYYKL